MTEQDVSRAMAFFQTCDDLSLLLAQLRTIQPRAAGEVRRLDRQHRDVPPPADIEAAPQAATLAEALRTVDSTRDFAQLQALARCIGRRIEELQPPG